MKNKILSLFVVSFLLFSCNNDHNKDKEHEQHKIDTTQQQVDKQIETKVSSQVSEINGQDDIVVAYSKIVKDVQNKVLDSSSFKYNCGGEKAGRIVFYRKGNQLKLIEKIYNEYSHTEGRDQYFVMNDKPFFVFKKAADWAFDSNANVEGATIDKISENRYYIVEDKLINCLQKQYKIRSVEKNKANVTANRKVDCPPLAKLLSDYNVLLSYQNQKDDMECL